MPPLVRNPLFLEFEKNIGIVTPLMQETILKADAHYPAGWVLEALQMAPKAERPSWAYVKGILKRWEEKGRDSSNGAHEDRYPPEPEPDYDELAALHGITAAKAKEIWENRGKSII